MRTTLWHQRYKLAIVTMFMVKYLILMVYDHLSARKWLDWAYNADIEAWTLTKENLISKYYHTGPVWHGEK